jgi:hypothetical protein
MEKALRVEDASIKNISFEEMTPVEAVQRMSTVHVFASVHGKLSIIHSYLILFFN